MRQADTTSYLTRFVGDIPHATGTGSFGTYTLAGHKLMDVHTFPLTFGRYTITLTNLSGTVDWGIALHQPGKPYQNRTTARKAASWRSAPGAPETITVTIDRPGTYALVVFKSGSNDVVKSGSYRLSFSQSTLDAVGTTIPTRTGLTSATPAPFRTDVRFGFELASAAPVTLEVLDVAGARRRVLANGVYSAGRQSVGWDGRDEAGHAVPPGLYLVRMLADGRSSTLKVVRTQ